MPATARPAADRQAWPISCPQRRPPPTPQRPDGWPAGVGDFPCRGRPGVQPRCGRGLPSEEWRQRRLSLAGRVGVAVLPGPQQQHCPRRSRSIRANSGDTAAGRDLLLPRQCRRRRQLPQPYKPLQPRLMGVPDALITRGDFQFRRHRDEHRRGEQNPWPPPGQPQSDYAIPVFGETNTVMWMLHSGLGGELTVQDGDGRPGAPAHCRSAAGQCFSERAADVRREFPAGVPASRGLPVLPESDAPSDEAGGEIGPGDGEAIGEPRLLLHRPPSGCSLTWRWRTPI